MIAAHVAELNDNPYSNKKGENTKKDWIYVFLTGLNQVEWGNKDMEACLKEVTVGGMQDSTDPEFDNKCASWQKTIW